MHLLGAHPIEFSGKTPFGIQMHSRKKKKSQVKEASFVKRTYFSCYNFSDRKLVVFSLVLFRDEH